jgi:DNA ligase-associated metallophosphoesterase
MSRHEIQAGVWLDHRRAVYLEKHRALCVADLHLGYAWAHRYSGQLMPLVDDGDLAERLELLCRDYAPERVVLLGDIIHQAVPVDQLRAELRDFLGRVGSCARLELVAGNHDRALSRIVPEQVQLHSELRLGDQLLVHGHDHAPSNSGVHMLMGHEHPAVTLGDGIKSMKCPCFLAAQSLLILPAFSKWAAGADIRRGSFLSSIAKKTSFTTVIAILGDKLLALPLARLWRSSSPCS